MDAPDSHCQRLRAGQGLDELEEYGCSLSWTPKNWCKAKNNEDKEGGYRFRWIVLFTIVWIWIWILHGYMIWVYIYTTNICIICMIWVFSSNGMKWVCSTGDMLQWWRCKCQWRGFTRIYHEEWWGDWSLDTTYSIIFICTYIYIHTQLPEMEGHWRIKFGLKNHNVHKPFAGWRTLSAPLTWHVGSSV